MAYRISTEALEDIENIWLYTFQNWSLEQADIYHNLIFKEIEIIVKDFNSGKDFWQISKRLQIFKSKIIYDIL